MYNKGDKVVSKNSGVLWEIVECRLVEDLDPKLDSDAITWLNRDCPSEKYVVTVTVGPPNTNKKQWMPASWVVPYDKELADPFKQSQLYKLEQMGRW